MKTASQTIKNLFKVGDYIYYYRRTDNYFDTIPGIIIKMGKERVKIAFSLNADEEEKWVSYNSIEGQQ